MLLSEFCHFRFYANRRKVNEIIQCKIVQVYCCDVGLDLMELTYEPPGTKVWTTEVCSSFLGRTSLSWERKKLAGRFIYTDFGYPVLFPGPTAFACFSKVKLIWPNKY